MSVAEKVKILFFHSKYCSSFYKVGTPVIKIFLFLLLYLSHSHLLCFTVCVFLLLQISLQMVLHDIQDQLWTGNHRIHYHNVHIPWFKSYLDDQARGCYGLWHGVPFLWFVLWRTRQGLCRDLFRDNGIAYWCTYGYFEALRKLFVSRCDPSILIKM